MFLDDSTLKKVARLARIHVSEDRLPALKKDLTQILEMVSSLQKVNTNGVEPLVGVGAQCIPLRDDKVTVQNQQEKILQNAPQALFGMFAVPKVVE